MNAIIPIFIIFIPPILYAFCNVWESRAMNGVFKSVPVTYFYAIFSVMLFSIPILVMSGQLTVIPADMLALSAAEAVLSVISIIIYYHAIKLIDVSVSQALYGAGAAVIPFMGMWIFGEYMNAMELAGFFIIIISGIMSSIDDLKRPRLNRGFFLMILATAALYAHILIEKEVVETVGWANSAFYHELMFMLSAALIFMIPKYRAAITVNYSSYKKNLRPFLIYGLFGAIAMMTSHYVVGEVPIALKEGVGGTQPFFVLIFAYILARIGLPGAKEEFTRAKVVQKVVCFAAMFIGLLMLLH